MGENRVVSGLESVKKEVIEYDVDEDQRALGEDGGQWWICGLENGASDGMNMTFQASDAKTALLSVRRVVEKGNQVTSGRSLRIATLVILSQARNCRCSVMERVLG